MKIRIPMSQRQKRLLDVFRRLPPPPWDTTAALMRARANRLAEMDVALRAQVDRTMERVASFLLTRHRGGSGFRMATTLRHYFGEFASRMVRTGAYSLPSSF